MSELRCPNCDHHIGNLVTDADARRRGQSPDPALDARVRGWANLLTWDQRYTTSELYVRYVEDTGDAATSHRRFSRAMQRVGFTKTRDATGRYFELVQ